MKPVAVLFARSDSVYKLLDGVDVWDADRDARKWPGSSPVVAHPPCRAWGRLRHFAKPRVDEKDLARWAVHQVRKYGGVLEHPAGSTLWPDMALPKPGFRDEFGGWTLAAPQKWWGHKAEKASWFYVVGLAASEIPAFPIVVDRMKYTGREHTPPLLAAWLVELARMCRP